MTIMSKNRAGFVTFGYFGSAAGLRTLVFNLAFRAMPALVWPYWAVVVAGLPNRLTKPLDLRPYEFSSYPDI